MISGPAPICYARGTLIRTDRDDVAIEKLVVGDIVVTASGEKRPIKWMGHRSLDCSRHPDPASVWPIRVSAGAFGENKPSRDLWLSPGHGISAEGVLITISALQNGKTVVQRERSTVEYWHIELDEHDVILAEGLPAETYGGWNKAFFANGGKVIEAHPDASQERLTKSWLKRVDEGVEVVRTKAVLLERAAALGHATTSQADLHLIADGRRIEPIELGTRYAFNVPAGCADIRLMSRTFVPAQTAAESTDARMLGIAATRLQLDGVDIALDDGAFFGEGWNELENSPKSQHRWTRGNTPLPPKTRRVVIDLCGTGHYWEEDEAIALFA